MIWSWIKNAFTAVALGTPSFDEKPVEKHDTKPVEQVKPSKLAEGGTLQKVDKYYGRTIAGGPGSQKIGDTFDALPQHEKDKMIAARKGRIVQETVHSAAAGDQGEQPARHGRLGRGIAAAVDRVYGDTPEQRLAKFKELKEMENLLGPDTQKAKADPR